MSKIVCNYISVISASLTRQEQRLTLVFAPDGTISKTTAGKRRFAWMQTTNNDNEGALGTLCVTLGHAPRISLAQVNALKTEKQEKQYWFVHEEVSRVTHTKISLS